MRASIEVHHLPTHPDTFLTHEKIFRNISGGGGVLCHTTVQRREREREAERPASTVSAGSRTAGTVHNLVHGTVCTLAWLGVTRPDPGVVLVV